MNDLNLEIALGHLEKYLKHKEHSDLVKFWELYPGPIPNWHVNMMNDESRNLFYKKEILAKCADQIIMEIGSGGGLLVQFALEAGAKHIYAIEQDPILQTCLAHTFKEEIARGRVTLLAKHTQHITSDDFVAGVPQIIMHEIFGSDLFSEHMLDTFNDLFVRKIIEPSMEFIPQKFSLWGVLHKKGFESKIKDPKYSNQFWYLEDISYFGTPTLETNFQTEVGEDLGAGFEIFYIDLKKMPKTLESEIRTTAQADGNLLRVWFELHGEQSTLSTDQNINRGNHWGNNNYFLRFQKGEITVKTSYAKGSLLTYLKD